MMDRMLADLGSQYSLGEAASAMLLAHPWPGNLRELNNVLRYAVALCGDGEVDGVRLLTPESISLMRDDQASFGTSVTAESPYGLFTNREETLIEGHTFYGHQGMFGGILCNVYFEPETQFCFILLTNGCNNVLQNHVGVLTRRQFVYAYDTFVNGDGASDPWLVQ